MNCLNTQRNILPFINRSLTEEETLAFLEHIQGCEECRDELEIYYMLYMGYNKLEAFEEPESYDLKGKMERELRLTELHVKISMTLSFVRRIAMAVVLCICVILLADFIL